MDLYRYRACPAGRAEGGVMNPRSLSIAFALLSLTAVGVRAQDPGLPPEPPRVAASTRPDVDSRRLAGELMRALRGVGLVESARVVDAQVLRDRAGGRECVTVIISTPLHADLV